MHSQQQQPISFFRRISNRLHVAHPTRRFKRPHRQGNIQQHRSSSQHHDHHTQHPSSHRHHTSASSTTSSVRRATQEATRQAAAVTGPPTSSFLIHSASSTASSSPPPPPPPLPPVPLNSSRNSIISSSDTTYLNELLSSAVFRDNNSVHSSSQEQQRGNSFLRYLQFPLRMQDNTATTSSSNTTPPQSSASSTTSRRMHILVIEYRTNSSTNPVEDTTTPLTPPPTYRFLGLRRPRSEVSTTSSTETIQSMPLSMNSTQTGSRNMAASQQQEGQWIVYVLNGSNNNSTNATPLQALSSSLVLEDNPSYEDLLWLTNMLGPARPNTTTQAAVDEAIPVTQWSNQDIKDEQCLVCLDEFAFKQPVRVLKCHHVFHRECVDRWLCEAHNSCPVCRGVPV
ncbi:hypothetical protein FB192DRAFT_1290541 [Mucor lusitanicus]|uniref:RING-type domain-containing protein n=1 Tax=Mucor circinelloides f. lusitanicus TaxID=29924 RepID=A0A8H4EXS5_MUCCL|nr:hypothetical protein FB192DRAFT_1290541 [Mucor lusitanicus]